MKLIHTDNWRTGIGAIAAVVLLAGTLTACGKDNDDVVANSVELDLAQTIHPDEEGEAALLVTGKEGTPWTMEIVSGETWASLDRTALGVVTRTGEVGTSLRAKTQYVFTWPNTTKNERRAVVRFTFQGEAPEDFELVQYSTDDNSNVYTRFWNESWPEIPTEKENANFVYVTHLAALTNTNGQTKTARNYTMCFDKTKKGSWWVAYPLHTVYTGSGRVETWAYDPKVAVKYQANLTSGFPEMQGNTRLYDRGHQIPNADRSANKVMQAQTFYFTNMTAQRSQLNQQPWAALEALARDRWMCSDTLYVVTGAYYGSKTTTDRSGQTVSVPDAYFKVFARTVAGNIRQAGDQLGSYQASQLQTIGFWVANAPTSTTAKDWVKSVEEIENLTGFVFFPTLPTEVKTQKKASAWGGL